MAEKKMVNKPVAKKRRAKKNIVKGIAHIQTTANNALITISDEQGNVICQSSSGALGYKGSRKSTPFAAQEAAKVAASKAKEQGLQTVKVEIKGSGQGRESAVRSFGEVGITVTEIKDVSPIPHNGCRPPKKRRI